MGKQWIRGAAAGLVLAAGLAVAFAQAKIQAIELGAAMPSATVKMKNIDGKELSLADVKGAKGTLVVFTCNHCPFAKGWEGRITEMGNTFKGMGIGVIAVNSNDPKRNAEDDMAGMVKRAADLKMAFPYVVDAKSTVAKAFGATRTPEAFLFDKDGKLAYHGTIDDNMEDAAAVKDAFLRDALTAVAAGKEPVTKTTKAVGCGIKFYE